MLCNKAFSLYWRPRFGKTGQLLIRLPFFPSQLEDWGRGRKSAKAGGRTNQRSFPLLMPPDVLWGSNPFPHLTGLHEHQVHYDDRVTLHQNTCPSLLAQLRAQSAPSLLFLIREDAGTMSIAPVVEPNEMFLLFNPSTSYLCFYGQFPNSLSLTVLYTVTLIDPSADLRTPAGQSANSSHTSMRFTQPRPLSPFSLAWFRTNLRMDETLWSVEGWSIDFGWEKNLQEKLGTRCKSSAYGGSYQAWIHLACSLSIPNLTNVPIIDWPAKFQAHEKEDAKISATTCLLLGGWVGCYLARGSVPLS